MSASFARARRALSGACILLLLATGLASCSKRKSGAPKRDADVVRYRLPLRENPVSSEEAFRCYGACQPEDTPGGYLNCLRECPGFDTTHGITCADYEVPPYAACLTARKLKPEEEIPPGWVAVATIAGTIIALSLASACTSNQNCNSWNMATIPPPQ